MNEETKTPRTDGFMLSRNEGTREVFDADEPYIAWTDYWALGELSKSLEHELTTITQERDVLRKKLDETPPAPSKDGMSKRERKLVKAIVNIKDRIPDISVRDWAKEQLEEALAAYEGKEEGK